MTEKEDSNVFVYKLPGTEGEFHCLECSQVCSYLEEHYCCDATANMPKETQKATSEFFRMCANRHLINLLAAAIREGKEVVMEDGSCAFCSSKKHHDEGWCKKQTPLTLFLRKLKELDLASHKHLEKYFIHRKQQKMIDVEVALRNVSRNYYQFHGMRQDLSDLQRLHMVVVQRRRERAHRRRAETSMENQNDECFVTMMSKWSQTRDELVRGFQEDQEKARVAEELDAKIQALAVSGDF